MGLDFRAPHLMLAVSNDRLIAAARPPEQGTFVIRTGPSTSTWDDRLRRLLQSVDDVISLLLLCGWNTDAVDVSRGGATERVDLRGSSISDFGQPTWRIPLDTVEPGDPVDGVRLVLSAHELTDDPLWPREADFPGRRGVDVRLPFLASGGGFDLDPKTHAEVLASLRRTVDATRGGLLAAFDSAQWVWSTPLETLKTQFNVEDLLARAGRRIGDVSGDTAGTLSFRMIADAIWRSDDAVRALWRRAHADSISFWLDLHNAGHLRVVPSRPGALPQGWTLSVDWRFTLRVQLSGRLDRTTEEKIHRALERSPVLRGGWRYARESEGSLVLFAPPNVPLDMDELRGVLTEAIGGLEVKIEPYLRQGQETLTRGAEEALQFLVDLYAQLPDLAAAMGGPFAEARALVDLYVQQGIQLTGEFAERLQHVAGLLAAHKPDMGYTDDEHHLVSCRVARIENGKLVRTHAAYLGKGVTVLHLDTGIQVGTTPEEQGTVHALLQDQHRLHNALDLEYWRRHERYFPNFPDHGMSTGAVIAGGATSPHSGWNDLSDYGVAPAAKLASMRVSRSVLLNLDGDAPKRILDWVIAASKMDAPGAPYDGVDVISISMGALPPMMVRAQFGAFVCGSGSCLASSAKVDMKVALAAADLLRLAMETAENAGIIVCAAAGQTYMPDIDLRMPVALPAAFPTVVSCGVLRADDTDPGWGFRGGGVRVSVRGTGLRAAKWDADLKISTESLGSGTSYSTALTAGVAALWLSKWKHRIVKKNRPKVFRAVLQAALGEVPGSPAHGKLLDAAALLEFDAKSELAPEFRSLVQ